MYKLKTTVNDADVKAFLASVEPARKREDSFVLFDMLSEITKEQPKMWGDSIVGFGSYSYQTKSGCAGEWMKIAFAPRKQYLSVYIMDGYDDYSALLEKLGKYKKGKSCLNINKLADVDLAVLKELMTRSYQYVSEHFNDKQGC